MASVLKFILGAAWYLQWVLLVFVVCVLVVAFAARDTVENDAPVNLLYHQEIPGLETTHPDFSDPVLRLKEGVLHYKARVEWKMVLMAFAHIGFQFFITLSITYLLRKIFRTLTHEVPFLPQNALRIRKIGILIMLLPPLHFFENAYHYWAASTHFTLAGEKLGTHLEFDFQTLLLGLVVLIIAEVFRIGTQLQQENELTV